MKHIHRLIGIVTVAILSATAVAAQTAEPLIGRVSRQQVDAFIAAWGNGTSRSNEQWNAMIEEIKHVRGGATVKVFMGVWCDDSKQEIPQFVRMLDFLEDEAPFTVEFFAVDERKQQPMNEIEANAIWFVPTFVVLRDGEEVGRIVEQPARTLETDLLRLLNGTARGLLSSNENVIVRYLAGADSQFP